MYVTMQVADVDEKHETQLRNREIINLPTPWEWWDSWCVRFAWNNVVADFTVISIHWLELWIVKTKMLMSGALQDMN